MDRRKGVLKMWIAIDVGAPVLVLSLLAALWPVMSRNYRYHRWEHNRAERHHRPIRTGRVRSDCSLCAASFEGASQVEAVAAKNTHVLRSHAQSGAEAVHPTTLAAVTRGA
jgi:hypothetical protein